MYGYIKRLGDSFETTVQKITEELKKEGFGILTEIDVKATLKKKLDIDFNKYIILGVCNPPFAYQALQAEQDIGLLLPCNIIIYEQAGSTYISTILPTVAMNMVNNDKLKGIAEQVEQKLKNVIDSV